jgi:long-chain-alcohol oxidase
MSKTMEYDIIIIGSGAGGGVVAEELSVLCKQGLKIALLEWGDQFHEEDNNRREVEMAGKYYFDYGGVQNIQKDMTFAYAKAVGGSTTVYTGTSLTAPDNVFKKWNVPGLTLSDMTPRYQKYIADNNVHKIAHEDLNDNNLLFEQGCKKLNYKVEQFPVNVKDCIGLGTCNLGCAILAKQGTHRVQIPKAIKNGVELIANCEAKFLKDHTVVCDLKKDHTPDGRIKFKKGPLTLTAQKIVLCASAINSPTLLLRSLGTDKIPSLGKYFTCHPALILAADHGRKIQNVTGHPKSFYCDHFHHTKKFLLETCMYFPFTLSKCLTGFGKDMDDLMGSYANLQLIIALIADEANEENRVTIDSKGQTKINYRISDDLINSFVEAIRESARIFFAAGAKRVHAPAMKEFFIYPHQTKDIDTLINHEEFKLGKISISAAHLMGGCRMGDDPKTSVTNSYGKLHQSDHIYVADASLFPNSSEVNPYLTIMALANRVAEGIIQNKK